MKNKEGVSFQLFIVINQIQNFYHDETVSANPYFFLKFKFIYLFARNLKQRLI